MRAEICDLTALNEDGMPEHLSPKKCLQKFEAAQTAAGVMGKFQIYVFFATQAVVMTVSPSILCGVFDGLVPENVNCSLPEPRRNLSGAIASSEFISLMMDLDLICKHAYLATLLKTTVMVGGVIGIGATVAGYLADRKGRRPLLIATSLGLACSNGLLSCLGSYNLVTTSILLICIGFFAGGNWVVNLVTLLESTPSQFWRLALTSFNFWPLGMMFMSVVGYLTGHWRWFHTYLSALGFIAFVPLYFIPESARWLVQMGRYDEAEKILRQIAGINGKILPQPCLGAPDVSKVQTKYNYMTFCKYPKLLVLLLAMAYNWLSSAIISYGIYFMLDRVVGNIFLNFFLTALFKGVTGCIPFFVSKYVGRKPVLIGSVGVTCLVCWAAVLVYFVYGKSSIILTVLTVLGTSAIDPMWKINHFYSSELFPTVVRNMARAVCNIGSRGGSLIGPQVAHLRTIHMGAPYIIFGFVSSIQLVVCIFLLPETKGRPLQDLLPDQLEEEENDKDKEILLIGNGFLRDNES